MAKEKKFYLSKDPSEDIWSTKDASRHLRNSLKKEQTVRITTITAPSFVKKSEQVSQPPATRIAIVSMPNQKEKILFSAIFFAPTKLTNKVSFTTTDFV